MKLSQTIRTESLSFPREAYRSLESTYHSDQEISALRSLVQSLAAKCADLEASNMHLKEVIRLIDGKFEGCNCE